MIVALPTHNHSIDNHFGHCAYFTLITYNANLEITHQEILDSPNGCGCKSNIAEVLRDKGVTVMLAGSMGDGAVKVLQNAGISVVRGCSGPVIQVADSFVKGSLKDSGDSCHAHEPGHECNH